jgi:hypothetical protein
MIKFLTSSLFVALLAIAQHASAQVPRLVPNTAFGTNGDGTIRPDDYDWLNSTNDIQRGMAYNPATGHLLVVCRTNAASPTLNRVMILDAATGLLVTNNDGSPKQLILNNLVQGGGNGSFLINMIACGDDGAIYAANLSNSQNPAQMALYRWVTEDDGATNPDAMQFYFLPDPASGIGGTVNRRWGDTFAVRGAGINTEILMASRGYVAALIKPTDTDWSSVTLKTLVLDQPVAALGYGLCFGAGNTLWGTSGAFGGGPLLHMAYDANAGTATTLHTYSSTNAAFPATVSPISILVQSNLLVGIDTRGGADMTRLYDVSNLANPPVLRDRQTWWTNFNNNVFAGSIVFDTNGHVFALNSDNGISAYTITNDVLQNFAPTIIDQPNSKTLVVSSNAVIYGAADGDAPVSYQWYYKAATNGSLTVLMPGQTNNFVAFNNAQLTNSGGYSFIATNNFGSVTSAVAQLNVVSAPQALYEGFDYPVGAVLTGQQNPYSQQKWVLSSGTAGTMEAGALSYPGLPVSTGNRFTWGSASMSERLPIGTNVSGTLYFSFLFKAETLGSWNTSDTIAGFGVNIGANTFSSKINIITNNPGVSYQLGIYKNGGTTLGALAPNIFTASDTVFVVGNYTFNSGSTSDDVINLWLNPDASTFGSDTPPTPTVGPMSGGTDVDQISFFFLRSTTNPSKKVADDVRVGYSWAEVTPLTPPTLAVAGTATNTFAISWPSYYSADFQLQSATNLSNAVWGNVTNAVGVVGNNKVVVVPGSLAQRFFRLIK